MKVIILAAGVGSRLRPLTDIKPKGMVKVNGIPIIEHQIKAYIKAGIRESDINIAVGYKSIFIGDYLNKNYPEVNMITNKVYDTTNNMFSLSLVLDHISEESIIISNGDCVYDSKIIQLFVNCKYSNSVASDKDSYTDENMKVIVENNRIKHISKQITKNDAYGNSIDLYKIDKSSIRKFKKIISSMIAEDQNLWSELALDKLFEFIEFNPFDIDGLNWMEIDNYDDLYEAEKKFSPFLISNKKCFVVDFDGTIYIGNKPIDGTIEFIKSNFKKFDFYFMTNNTSRNLNDYIDKLKVFGIETSLDRIISPLIPLIKYLNKHEIKNVFIVGNDKFKQYLKENILNINFTSDKNECQAVVVAYDTELTYEKLKDASLLLHNIDIKLLATHEDVVCPTEFGNIPDIGSILGLLEVTTKRKPKVIFGKPNSVLLDTILEKYKKDEIAIVGDRLYTDKVLANNSNIDFVLVLSGETKREDIECLEKFPEAIVNDLGDIF